MAWGTGKFAVECLVLCANSHECVVPQTPRSPLGKTTENIWERTSSPEVIEHRKSESVMVTPKKCKFLQLCEHQLSVKVTPTWCTFTPQ